jgi:hypothetical protein
VEEAVLRKLIIAACVAAAFAVPAAAQPYPDDDEIVRDLPPPGEIEEIGDRLGRTADAVMDVDVAPIVDAVDPQARRYRRHRDVRVGDIVSHGDPYARDRIQDSIAAATFGIEAALRQIAILTPVLRRSIEDAERRMDDAMRRDPRDRDRDYDRDRDRDYDPDYDRDRDYDPEGRR